MEKKPSLAMRYAMPAVEINQDGDIVPDSPFSFLSEVRESMGGIIGRRLEYINLADADESMETQMECYKHYVVTLFSPFHDHLTLLILGDYNLRQRVYCLIFNELSDFGVNGFAGMNYYLSGPLFANAFFAPPYRGRHPKLTTYYNSGRKLRDISPMPRFDHLPGVQVRIDKNRDARVGDLIMAPMPYFGRMAITKEGRRYQKLVGGVTHTADGRPIDDDGNVGELEETTIFSKEYMENLRHLNPDLKENVLLEIDSFSSEESLAKVRPITDRPIKTIDVHGYPVDVWDKGKEGKDE